MASLQNLNICPALIQTEGNPTELTEEEFKRTLVTWFEDRGLLSELRAHLRKQMIGILKDTTLGQNTTKRSSKLSPKDHVMNLLVAEFLLKHRYHYSLSVFSTEVPYFINLLPDFTNIVQNGAETTSTKNFSQQHFCDILETLGFIPDSYESKKIQELYFQSNETSVLNCMITLLPKLTKIKLKADEKMEDTSKLETWVKDIHNLLVTFEINSSYIPNLRNQIKFIFERELSKVKSDEEVKFKTRQENINDDILRREGEIKKLITEMESTYNRECKRMSEEHLKELKNVEKLKAQYKQSKNDFEQKLDELNKREGQIKQKEIELSEQLEILKSRTKIMQNVYDTVIDENKKLTLLHEQQNQGKTSEFIQKLSCDCSNLRQEIENTKKTIETLKKESLVSKGVQTLPTTDNSEFQLLKQMLERVQNENGALRILNNEQQRRLEEISTQNASLINDLETCQSTINVLTRTNSQRGIVTVPPIMPVPFSRSFRQISTQNGGGENLGYVPNSPPIYRHANHSFRNYNRRKVAKMNQNKESSSSSSSPTEDILLEARERLRRLEKESENIDRHYRHFREKQSRQNANYGTFSITNIPESIRATHSRSREILFSSLRPTFQSRLSELPSTSTRNLTAPINFNFNPSNFSKKIETSSLFNFNKDILSQDKSQSKCDFEVMNNSSTNAEQGAHKQSAGPSVESSGISQLQNLSLSSIDMSSDSMEDVINLNDNENNNNKNNITKE